MSGEHAREVITAEVSIGVLRAACEGDMPSGFAITIVPIVNLGGRQMVEGGELCRRTNARGVDLNRNFPSHFQAVPPPSVTERTSREQTFLQDHARHALGKRSVMSVRAAAGGFTRSTRGDDTEECKAEEAPLAPGQITSSSRTESASQSVFVATEDSQPSSLAADGTDESSKKSSTTVDTGKLDLGSFPVVPPPFSPWEVYPGPAPFSEEETRSLRDIILRARPHGYLTLHSGAYTLMESPAWTEDGREAGAELRQAMRAAVHSSHGVDPDDPMAGAQLAVRKMREALGVDLPRGAAGTTLHYVSPGTSLDWAVLKAGVLVSVAAEVYAGDEQEELARWAEERRGPSLLQHNAGGKAGRLRSRKARTSAARSRGVLSAGDDGAMAAVERFDEGAPVMSLEEAVGCFNFFNPTSKEGVRVVVDRWVAAARGFLGAVRAVSQGS